MTLLLCACAVVITLKTQKCQKGAHSVELKEGQIYKTLPHSFNLIFQSLVMILPRFFDFERA